VDRLARVEDDPTLRILAAEMLSALGGPSVPSAHRRLLADPVCVVRYEAIQALGAAPCEDSYRLLDEVFASPEDSQVHERAAAAAAAGGLRYVPGLVRALNDPHERVQVRAIRELSTFDPLPPEAMDPLRKLADTPSVLGAREQARSLLRSRPGSPGKERK
jgi:HEAT repeat protein